MHLAGVRDSSESTLLISVLLVDCQSILSMLKIFHCLLSQILLGSEAEEEEKFNCRVLICHFGTSRIRQFGGLDTRLVSRGDGLNSLPC